MITEVKMNITDRAGVSGTNVVGVLSRGFELVVKFVTSVEDIAVAHSRYRKLVASGMEPAAAAAKVFDQTAGRAPVISKPSTRQPATGGQGRGQGQGEVRLAA